jgi:hypothetical protein
MLRHFIVLLLALSLGAPVPAAPQSPPPPRPPPGPKPRVFIGSFEGSAVLTNEDAGSSCRYQGESGTPSVRLELGAGTSVAGSIAIDMPAPQGAACPTLRKRYSIAEFVLEGPALSFMDSGGNEWTLSFRENGVTLQGLLAWRQGGAEEPLAEGFSLPGGRRPLARLSGEVQLRRLATGGAGAAAPTAPPVSAGKQAGHIGAIIGANVVGLGLLYGANKLGKGSSESGVVTCSPRTCIVGAPNAPCFCEGNVLSGASCGTTRAGAPIGGFCEVPGVPCQSGLSCNSGLCEDRDGRCPY